MPLASTGWMGSKLTIQRRKKGRDQKQFRCSSLEKRHARCINTRCAPTFEYETRQWEMGLKNVIGVDEVGRGALAGPVLAVACLLPPSMSPQKLRDSKKLTEKCKQKIFQELMSNGILHGVCYVEAGEIDEINIHNASLKAMKGAVHDFQNRSPGVQVDCVLIDGKFKPSELDIKCQTIIGGDALSCSIAAASVIAKVKRDQKMIDLDELFPEYGFSRHKGYGTQAHLEALRKHGPSPIHRKTYKPIRQASSAADKKASVDNNCRLK